MFHRAPIRTTNNVRRLLRASCDPADIRPNVWGATTCRLPSKVDSISPRSPTSEEYFKMTSFRAHSKQNMRGALFWADSKLREGVRWVESGGRGKKSVIHSLHK